MVNPPVPHQGRGQVQHPLMIPGLSLVPNAEAPVVIEPGVDALHDPAPRRVVDGLLLLSNLPNMREVSRFEDPLLAVGVCLVEAEMLNHDRPRDDDSVDGLFEDDAVVSVGAYLDDAEREASHVGQDGLLDAAFGTVGRVRPGPFVGLAGLGEAAVDALENPGDLPAFVGVLGESRPHLAELTSLCPPLKPAMAGRAGGESLRQFLPLAAGPHAVEDGIQYQSQVRPRTAGSSTRRVSLEYRGDEFPEVIWDLANCGEPLRQPSPGERARSQAQRRECRSLDEAERAGALLGYSLMLSVTPRSLANQAQRHVEVRT